MISRAIVSGIAVATLALAATAVEAPKRPHPQERERNGFPLEVEDQPPAKYDPRTDALARTPALTVQTGPYVSIQINVDAAGHNIVGDAANEPSIAVNPTNPANMVVVWRQFNSVSSNFRQAGWAYTFDAGQTWTFPGVLTPGTFRSDPVVDADLSGTFYWGSLKSNFTLDTFKSADGGKTWSGPVPSYGGDKNWLVVDRSPGPRSGAIYQIWQRFASCCDVDVLTRSGDNAITWDFPLPVPYSPTFGTLAVGPDSTLYSVGIDGEFDQNFEQFVLAYTTNAADPEAQLAFRGRFLDLGGSMVLGASPNPAGLIGQGNVAVDNSNGATRGNVYALASVEPFFGSDPADVQFARSTDNALTFSTPVRVNDDASTANWQWAAQMSVAPNGRIDVIWYDTRDSGVANISRLYYAYSWDAGVTWSPNVPVSPPFDSTVGWPQQSKMGDYIGIVSGNDGADVAYSATFNNSEDVYYVRLFPDCNGNGVSDVIDLASHTATDCDLNHVPDSCQASVTCIGAGAVAESAAGGTPLSVDKGAAGAVTLAWGASCAAGDADYAVYQGSLGAFSSHLPVSCSTGGAQTATFVPQDGDSYFLVVPVHADREGSYGTDGTGAERPPSASACAPQALRACGL